MHKLLDSFRFKILGYLAILLICTSAVSGFLTVTSQEYTWLILISLFSSLGATLLAGLLIAHGHGMLLRGFWLLVLICGVLLIVNGVVRMLR